jgi:GNAT superfamily N-acetyltransferase
MNEEGLTDATLAEVIQFVRDSNPFSQQTWGWDTGRFIDWRWGSNIIRAAANPEWFADACRIFRDGQGIRAVAIAEYGSQAECILTPRADAEVGAHILSILLARHRERGIEIGLEFAGSAEWLRDVCRDAGLAEKTETGCEWEYELESLDTDVALPPGFAIDSLGDSADADRKEIAECIELAFDAPRDLEGVLRNIETNPMFRPELSVFARSPEGVVAAYCRGTVDPVSGVCGIDPICTHPEYQKLGLGKAVVRTVFARQRMLGGKFAYIGSAPPPAPGTFLYRSLGPSGMSIACEWVG